MQSNPISEIESKRSMYLTNMLSETLPAELINDAMMAEIQLDSKAFYGLIHIIFSNKLKTTIESKDTGKIADWKSNLHKSILEPLSDQSLTPICMLNMAPYTRTIIFGHHYKEETDLRSALGKWHKKVLSYLQEGEVGRIVTATESSPSPIGEIGKSYKRLRLLMDYRYIIGMDQMVYYQDMVFESNYNITEYKYLQRFESLLSIDQFADLIKMTDEIHSHVKHHLMNNSKVIYIYKELLAMLIRYLYKKETDNIEAITELNQAIMSFEDTFDDIDDVTAYLKASLHNLGTSEQLDSKDYHPHIKKVLQIIEQRYQTDVGLSDIARELKLSDAYLSRLFKEEVTIGFKEYLTKYRLKRIKDMLTHTNRSILDIARATGYNTADQMTRIFKKYEQQTPSEYRHQKST